MNKDINFNYSVLKTYYGYIENSEKQNQSASGGAATILAENIIKNGGVIFGVKYTDDFYGAEYCCIDNINDLIKVKSSKYVFANKMIKINGENISVYKAVVDYLLKGKEVLFVGLGCDIGIMKKYVQSRNINTDKLYLVDLICQGPTLPIVQKLYINQLEKKYNSLISEFSVRSKKYGGWKKPYIYAKFLNEKEFFEPFYSSEFAYAFDKYSCKTCYSCNYKGENHQSDITIGDFWGITSEMKEYNRNGVSIFFVRTNNGQKLIDRIDKNNFLIDLADTKFALLNNPMYYLCRKDFKNYYKFNENLRKVGLHKAIVIDIGRIKYLILSFKRFIKKIVNK